ncbi:MAG TPA: hypothetical protein VLM19_01400 [Nitrospiraceae bacterium]|nr:hypothetical protein [Nitrospiraceae bacterium]
MPLFACLVANAKKFISIDRKEPACIVQDGPSRTTWLRGGVCEQYVDEGSGKPARRRLIVAANPQLQQEVLMKSADRKGYGFEGDCA